MKITTLVLKAKLKGVSPVKVHGVVWNAHRTPGSSSTHLSFDSSSLVLSPLSIVRFVTSAMLLVCGWSMDVNWC